MVVALVREHAEKVRPPRALWVPYPLGRPFGEPNDATVQTRVLRQALELLDAPAGPVLVDAPEPADQVTGEIAWVCPVSLAKTAAQTGDFGTRVGEEMAELRPWYDLGLERRGRTTVGLATTPVHESADWLARYVDNPQHRKAPGATSEADLLRWSAATSSLITWRRPPPNRAPIRPLSSRAGSGARPLAATCSSNFVRSVSLTMTPGSATSASSCWLPTSSSSPAQLTCRPLSRTGAIAVLAQRLDGIVKRMQHTLVRSSRSGVIVNGHDCSCCLLSGQAQLLSTAQTIPIHVMSGADEQARSMKAFHPDLKRGDAYLHNSPYHGATHAADLTVLVPIIDDHGVHRFTALAKSHQADIGNAQPTTYMVEARDLYEEGALIFPAVKIQHDFETIEDIVRMGQMRIRAPTQWSGDLLGLIGATRIGERQVGALPATTAGTRSRIFHIVGSTTLPLACKRPLPGAPLDGRGVRVDTIAWRVRHPKE